MIKTSELEKFEYTLKNGWQTAVHWPELAQYLETQGFTARSKMPEYSLKVSFGNWHIWKVGRWTAAQLKDNRYQNHEFFDPGFEGLASALNFVLERG